MLAIDFEDGLDTLAAQLRALPEFVQARAGAIVQGAAQRHHDTMQAIFPLRDGPTGNLRRANTLVVDSPLRARSYNNAPHAHLYESGFKHWRNGAQVAGAEVFVSEAIGIRADMLNELQGVVDEAARDLGMDVRR